MRTGGNKKNCVGSLKVFRTVGYKITGCISESLSAISYIHDGCIINDKTNYIVQDLNRKKLTFTQFVKTCPLLWNTVV